MSCPLEERGDDGGKLLMKLGIVAVLALFCSSAFAQTVQRVNPPWKVDQATPQTFADVIAENTVTDDLLDGSIQIPAQKLKSWPLVVNQNMMNDVEIEGHVTPSGGMGGEITLALYALNGQSQPQPIYTCRATNRAIDKKLPASGAYAVVTDSLSRRGSRVVSRRANRELPLLCRSPIIRRENGEISEMPVDVGNAFARIRLSEF